MNVIRRHLSSFILAALIVGTAVTLICRSAEARQVASETVVLLFTFFTTPFVLETSMALLGIMAVLMINQRRLDKEQDDEWVEMEVPVKPAASSDERSHRD